MYVYVSISVNGNKTRVDFVVGRIYFYLYNNMNVAALFQFTELKIVLFRKPLPCSASYLYYYNTNTVQSQHHSRS
jgi:hypothetical protein